MTVTPPIHDGSMSFDELLDHEWLPESAAPPIGDGDASQPVIQPDRGAPAQLELITGAKPRRGWRLDARTRRVGRLGVAEAKAILAATHSPAGLDAATAA